MMLIKHCRLSNAKKETSIDGKLFQQMVNAWGNGEDSLRYEKEIAMKLEITGNFASLNIWVG